ncbi:MAG TPA: MFS transporter, partial [Novosphingobium sp.]|nr:MFS transporter [Novosphingobium sp.]
VLVALLVLTLREPPRIGAIKGEHPSFRQVLAYIGQRKRTYFTLMLGFAIAGTVWNGAVAWLPEFYKRTFGWDVATVGLRFGLVTIVSGTLGAITGGTLASRNRARGITDANVRIGLVSLAVLAPGGLLTVLSGDPALALAGNFIFLFGCAMPFGAAAAAIQEITPNQMRGQVSAIYLFGLSFFGMGFGPTIVAFFTDSVFGNDAAIGQSIAMLIVIATPIAAVLLMAALRPYRETLASIEF